MKSTLLLLLRLACSGVSSADNTSFILARRTWGVLSLLCGVLSVLSRWLGMNTLLLEDASDVLLALKSESGESRLGCLIISGLGGRKDPSQSRGWEGSILMGRTAPDTLRQWPAVDSSVQSSSSSSSSSSLLEEGVSGLLL